ncbi:MAG: hypothetical protein QOH76_3594 [Thermoleophilaceae bacterium]|nr:hypothetical protein [Thermoleophilaceae bacterium]
MKAMSLEPARPALRASDADREAVAERLRVASVDGRLDSEELEQRVAAAYSARWVADLDRLVADISPPPPPAPPPYAPSFTPSPYPPVQYAPETNGLAVASLVAGVLWVVWLGSFLAVAFGHTALSQIKQSGGRQTGTGLAIAGLVMGYLGVATFALSLLFWI